MSVFAEIPLAPNPQKISFAELGRSSTWIGVGAGTSSKFDIEPTRSRIEFSILCAAVQLPVLGPIRG